MKIIGSFHGYAGFLLRFLAFCIDTAILSVGLLFFQLIFSIPVNYNYVPSAVPLMTPLMMSYNVFAVVIVWLYYALFESSKWQATLGKKFIKIKVTDMHGNRISFGRATGRHFAKILSSLILFFGYIMIMFTKKKQGLHDIIAETLVVRD